MKETQGALSMLLRRYRLILGKCRWNNMMAGLVLGAILSTPAVILADSGGKQGRPGYPEGHVYTGTVDGASGDYASSRGNIVIDNNTSSLDSKDYHGGYVDGKGDAMSNTVLMRGSGSTAKNLYGGFSDNGQVSGNNVVIENGLVGGTWGGGRVYGGYTDAGNAVGNTIEIRNGNIEGLNTDVVAGYTQNGDSTGNRLTISGGRISRTNADHFVSAGVSREGNARGNTLIVTGGELGEKAYGGHVQAGDGDAADNHVEFSGAGSTVGELTAGMSGGADAHGNTLTMSGGTVRTYLIGGNTLRGLASGNKIEMHGGQVGQHVYAGYADRGGASANELLIDGGTIAGSVYGSYISNNSSQNTEGSKVSFGGTASAQFLVGGYSARGDAVGNEVTVSGGAIRMNVLGGESDSAAARNNTVRVTGGTIGTESDEGFVHGGYSKTGSADNNTVIIEGGNLRSVMGGYVESGAGSVNGNTVLFSGGSISGAAEGLYGGYTDEGDASGNTVRISGGTPGSEVCGGFVWTGTGSATGNTVILEGAPDLGGTSLYGGATGNGHGDMRTGNTLEVRTSGLKAVNVGNFASYRFILPEKTTAGTTVLTLTDAKGTDISNSSVGVAVAGGKPLLRKGDSVTLLANEHGLKAEGMTHERLSARQGVFVEYDFDLKATDTSLLATVAGDAEPVTGRAGGERQGGGTAARLAPQAKAPLEGVLANVALSNIGADLVAGQGIDQARTAVATKGDGPAWGIAPFAAVTGTRSRYQTGSHVDLSGVAFMTGFAKRVETSMMDILAGVFFEAGFARVDTHNSFSDGPSVDGDGRSSYYGGGLLARLDLKEDLLKGLYLEGSFRYGRLNSQWQSDDLHDAVSGRKAEYDLSTPYYGLHAGLGYVWNLTDSLALDVYGKYFWTHTDGQSTHIVDDPWSFDSVDSQRLRLGARLGYEFCQQVTGYAGAAWEHEFNGKARATTYGLEAPAPSLKGDSGLLEAGLTLKPVAGSGLSLDFGVQGHTGVRQGVSGTALVRYEF